METGCGHEGDCVRTSAEAVFEFLSRQAEIAHAVPDLVTNVLILVGTGILLFVINPLLAALTLIPIPFLVLGSGIFTKKVLPNFREAQGKLGYQGNSGFKNALKKGQENTLPSCFKGKCDISSRCGNDKLPWNGYCRGLWRMVCIKRLCFFISLSAAGAERVKTIISTIFLQIFEKYKLYRKARSDDSIGGKKHCN